MLLLNERFWGRLKSHVTIPLLEASSGWEVEAVPSAEEACHNSDSNSHSTGSNSGNSNSNKQATIVTVAFMKQL